MKFNHISLAVTLALGASALTACGVYNKFDVADQSPLAAEYAKADSITPDSTAYGNLYWQEVFTDPILKDLIERALENNVNLENARLNVEVAHAQLKGAKLAYLPSVGIGATGQGAKFGGNRLPMSDMQWTYNIPLSVSWEIDVFGKLLTAKRGAKAALLQSEAYQRAVRSQIISSVAACFYSISSIEAQLDLSRKTAESWKESVEVMKNLKLAGRVTEAAVVQSTAQYYGILASITDLEVSLDESYNTMSLLLNTMPQKWNIPAAASELNPNIVRERVLMAELAARPDVKAAEQSLASAFYATANARAAFYPALAITLSGGLTNSMGTAVVNPAEFFINLAGSLTVPLFSRGQNIARLEAAKAQQKQALNNFEYTLMSAASEVSDAMTIFSKSREKMTYLEVQADNLAKAVDYSTDLLNYGSNTTYLEVLTAQQSLLQAQIGVISCRLAQQRSLINLYQSLGGGR